MDALDRSRGQVARRAMGLISEIVSGGDGASRTKPAAGRLDILARALAAERDAMQRQYGNVYPAPWQVAACDERHREELAQLTHRYERIVNTDIPDCLKVLNRASDGCSSLRRTVQRQPPHGGES
jgi:hypothetical protein